MIVIEYGNNKFVVEQMTSKQKKQLQKERPKIYTKFFGKEKTATHPEPTFKDDDAESIV